MPKGDSKRKKADKDGISNKKQKGEPQRQSSITSASTEITMTIPRKKDNKNKAATAAPANNDSSSSFSMPKIPKKSDKQQQSSKSLSPSVDVMMGSIPKKKADKRSSVGSLDSMPIPKKSNKSTNNTSSGNKSEKQTSSADNKSSSTSTSNTSNKTPTTEKATGSNKKEGTKVGVDSSSSKKDKDKIATTTTVVSTPGTKDSRTTEMVSASSKITPKKLSGNKAGATPVQQQQPQPQKPRGRGRPPSALKLKIDTSVVGSTIGDQSSSTKGGSNKPPMTPSSGTAMDSHPFARGSVIEVLHGVFKDPSGDSWWSDDSDEEESKKEEEEKNKNEQTVRLCDVIDRVATDANKNHWRYYVHYRDFNRRMDEWIPMERIVSPPSVGNAKARALKKEEERQKRKQQRLEEKKAELQSGVNVSGPRASRRRSTVVNNQQQPAGAGSGGAATGTGGTSGGGDTSTATAGSANTPIGADGETDTPRRTRLRRRSVDDDGTVVASNQSGGGGDKSSKRGGDVGVGGGSDGSGGGGGPPPVVMAAEKGVVAIQTQAATHTTVGEHVVATIPAQELDEHEGLDEASLREHEEVTKVKNVEFLELGAYQMETWYFSPLPKELLNEKGLIDVLYVCEFTFNMFARKSELRRFQSRLKPHMRHPPGNEIYRNGNIAMFEVDGFEQRIYCQNLCYIAKLFLDHKTLYFDVDPFLFYVLCEVDKRGFHPVGYYSKEKYSDVGYNLACILTFPCHQRKGYGRFLIAFSYELSKKEEKVGSPEKPMSDLGQQAYKPYWASTIVDFLLNQSPDSSSMSIMDISKQTSIMAEDIVFTLNQLGILKIINGVYFIAAEAGLLRTLAKKYPVKKPVVDPSKLHWTPFITENVKRDKFSIHSKKASVDSSETRGDRNDALTK